MNKFLKIGKISFVILLTLHFLFAQEATSQTVNCNGYNPWFATQVYNTETVVLNGVLYQSQWYNVNQSPATNSGQYSTWHISGTCAQPILPATTSCANIATWSNPVAYNAGAQVIWNNYKYTASFWTQGVQPDINTNNPWHLEALCQSPASLTVTGTLTPFSGYTGSFSTSQTFAISGSNLSNNLVNITAPANFEISLSQASGYTSNIQLTPVSGALSTTVYVVYSPSALGTDNGNIVISSTGVTTQNLAVTGTAQAIWMANGTYIYNANSGNVGIGTTGAPTSKLEVIGTTKTTGLQMPTGAGAGKVLTSDATGLATWQTVDLSAGWNLAGNSITSGDNNFIGTTNTRDLIFKTNNEEAIRVDGHSSNKKGEVTIGLLQGSEIPGTPSSYKQKLNVNGNTSIFGGLSIGETTSYIPTGYTLAVNGKVIATEIAVKLRNKWPDYVFAKEYKLMSLSEVESFIKKHQHLPGMPTSSEIESNGMQVGEVNTVMVEKIEELTLHAIEQQKLIDDLLKVLEAQNKRLENLENK